MTDGHRLSDGPTRVLISTGFVQCLLGRVMSGVAVVTGHNVWLALALGLVWLNVAARLVREWPEPPPPLGSRASVTVWCSVSRFEH